MPIKTVLWIGLMPYQLQVNLRNAEATFGKGSSQYLDIMEIIENYMATTDDTKSENPSPAEKKDEQAPSTSFANLVFRPKP